MIPPRTILAATDFSDPSTAALVCAARLARHCQAALHVVHAEDPLLDAAAGHAGINLAAQTRQELQCVIAAARPAADCSPNVHVVTGSAVDVILDVARAQHADLIVVGSRGMSGRGEVHVRIDHGGHIAPIRCIVLVVPPQWMPPRPAGVDLAGMGPLIAGVDMSDSSLTGARAACRLASTFGTSVEIIHVVPDLAVLARWKPHATRALDDRFAEAHKELERAVNGLRCQVPVEWRVERGAVADRLASIAGRAADRAPLLVLGKKAPHSGGGAPGTIAYRVLSLAEVPVLMVVD